MSVRSLRFALTLADELHFGRAARRHYIAAQPFGRAIRELEDRLGYRIFERTSRRVAVTPRGVQFLFEAQAVVDSYDELLGHPEVDQRSDHLVFAVLGFGIGDLWPALRAELMGSNPALSAGFRDVTIAEQYEAVRRSHADVGLVQFIGPVDGLDLLPVASTDRVAIVPTDSPLADAPLLHAKDLSNSHFVDVDTGASGIERWAGPAWLDGRSGDQVRYPAAFTAAVAMTGRIALQSAAAEQYYPNPHVKFVPLEGEGCEVAIAVRSDDRRPAIDLVRAAAHAVKTFDTWRLHPPPAAVS